jgi:hypothetical protein
MFALRHTAQSLATYNDKQYACGWWGSKTPTSHLASGPEAKENATHEINPIIKQHHILG